MSGWLQPLSVALSVQLATSVVDVAVPVLAPAITAALGVPPQWVGYYASAMAAGALGFFLLGSGLVHRGGALRALRAAAVVSGLGLLLVSTGVWPLALLAGLLVGVGFAVNAPAGSALLQGAVPEGRRNLAFSVKQAGVPLGAVLAGAILPPLAAAWGWQAALLAVSGAAVLVALALGLPARGDAEARRPAARAARRHGGPRRGRTGPARLLRLSRLPGLRRLTLAGGLFALVQGSVLAFLVTYLVQSRGLSLVAAGGLYAVAQFAGVAGRIAAGWLADRRGSAVVLLRGLALATAGALLLLATLPATAAPSQVLGAVAALGLVIGNWNGVLLAEVARICPAARVPEATSLCALGVFAGILIGPSLFAQTVQLSGGFDLPLRLTAVAALLPLLLLRRGEAR